MFVLILEPSYNNWWWENTSVKHTQYMYFFFIICVVRYKFILFQQHVVVNIQLKKHVPFLASYSFQKLLTRQHGVSASNCVQQNMRETAVVFTLTQSIGVVWWSVVQEGMVIVKFYQNLNSTGDTGVLVCHLSVYAIRLQHNYMK